MRAATVAQGSFGMSLSISIPAAHAGCDLMRRDLTRQRTLFQSPQPMRAATAIYGSTALIIPIFCFNLMSIFSKSRLTLKTRPDFGANPLHTA